jgi:hypothetical protein
VGSCNYGDEPAGSGATDLLGLIQLQIMYSMERDGKMILSDE